MRDPNSCDNLDHLDLLAALNEAFRRIERLERALWGTSRSGGNPVPAVREARSLDDRIAKMVAGFELATGRRDSEDRKDPQ